MNSPLLSTKNSQNYSYTERLSTELLESLPTPPPAQEDPGRYNQEHTQRICHLIAYYTPYPTMVEALQREYRRSFPFKHYVWFRKALRWQPLIANLRQQYLANFENVPIAQQRVRLERLETLYHEAKTVQVKTMVLKAASEELKDPALKTQTNIAITAYYQMSAQELEEKRRDVINKLRHLKAQEHAEGSAGGSDVIIEA